MEESKYYTVFPGRYNGKTYVQPSNILGGDKVSILMNTYPFKPLRKIKVTICNFEAERPLYM